MKSFVFCPDVFYWERLWVLDHYLKPVMQSALSYIRDSQHVLEKIKTIVNPLHQQWQEWLENVILVTADVVGLYSIIAHQRGLKTLKEALPKRDIKKIPTEDLVNMAEFVLNSNIFEFNNKTYHQKSGPAIQTKSAPPYACIWGWTKVSRKAKQKTVIWFRYVDDIFWTLGEQDLETFWRI